MAKSLTKQLTEAKEKIKTLETELTEVRADRSKYQNWMGQDLRSYITMAGKNQYWSSESMIERIAKRLQQTKPFYW